MAITKKNKLPTEKRKIHYLSRGNGLAGIYVEDDGNGQLYYAYTDYLGSLTALTDAGASVKERQAFDPWGNRRNPNNWTSLITTPVSNITARGYTMHEHLDAFDLINMNGRVYDPLTSRFLSADPFIQAPGQWLNYDRYAYAMNNPMFYNDPNGYIFKKFGNWVVEQLNEGWDALNQFARWAHKTDWFPSSGGAGINSAGNTWHYVGNSGNIYHNQLGNDYGGVVNAAISEARGREAYVSGNSSLADAQSQGSTDMNGAGVLRNTGDALSYTAGAIGGAQIGMMQYRSSLSIHSKVGTFPRFSSTYSSVGKFSGRLGTAGALVGVGFNINDLSTGEIGLGRFSYRLGSIGAAAGTGAAIGGPWGAVVGTAVGGISTGFEYIYDNYLVPLGNEIQYQIWNFENAIKNGWYPGR